MIKLMMTFMIMMMKMATIINHDDLHIVDLHIVVGIRNINTIYLY